MKTFLDSDQSPNSVWYLLTWPCFPTFLLRIANGCKSCKNAVININIRSSYHDFNSEMRQWTTRMTHLNCPLNWNIQLPPQCITNVGLNLSNLIQKGFCRFHSSCYQWFHRYKILFSSVSVKSEHKSCTILPFWEFSPTTTPHLLNHCHLSPNFIFLKRQLATTRNMMRTCCYNSARECNGGSEDSGVTDKCSILSVETHILLRLPWCYNILSWQESYMRCIPCNPAVDRYHKFVLDWLIHWFLMFSMGINKINW